MAVQYDQLHIITNYPTFGPVNEFRGVAFTKYNYIKIA